MVPSQKPARNYRSSLIFLAGLLLAAGTAVSLDGAGAFMASAHRAEVSLEEARAPVAPAALSDADWHAARVAWRYFEQNYRPETGLVDSVAGFPSGTLWDQGSYLHALNAAAGIGLISPELFEARVTALLAGLERLELFGGLLPNKVYHAQTLQMVDYQNNPAPEGVGWSALDIARMLLALRVLEHRHPQFGPPVRRVIARWQLQEMARQGELIGAAHEDGTTEYLQEGRIGYEQYGARAAVLWGLDALEAVSAARILEWEEVSGARVAIDRRRSSAFRAVTPALSEPYFLHGLEMGLSGETRVLASRIYDAQENRFRSTGQMTMVSEDHIDQDPYFVYSSVYSNGTPWAVVNEQGRGYPELRTVSLKAAFAWDALYRTEYTGSVRASLLDLETEGGWAAGRYETTGETNSVLTLNTNAVVLEAIHYIARGPLWSFKH
jgi:hypothetical protein